MHQIVVERPEVRVVGHQAEVVEEHAEAVVGGLWARVCDTPMVPGDPALAVYFDYQDKVMSRYRVLVGAAGDGEPPEGQAQVTVPAGRYLSLEADGDPGEAADRLWTWACTRLDGRYTRRFHTDVELHEDRGGRHVVTLLLGIE